MVDGSVSGSSGGGVLAMAGGGERGTEDVRAVLAEAEREALSRGAGEVSSIDLVLAVLTTRPGHTGAVLERHRLARGAVEAGLAGGCGGAGPSNGGSAGGAAPKGASAGGAGAKGGAPAQGPLPPAPELAAAVQHAMRRASEAGRPRFDAEDLLLATLDDRAAEASRLLDRIGVDRGRVRGDLAALKGQAEAIGRASAAQPCPFHVGPGSCSVGAGTCSSGGASAPCGPPPAVPGLGGEVRDLAARFDALVQNHDMLRDRVDELVRYLRVVWAGSLILLGAVGFLLFKALR